MSKRHLLICFDAFGTLFTPKKPVAQQYGEVARSLGLSGFSDDDVQTSFSLAYKKEAKMNPNFGKAAGMDAEKWWTNIIQSTFQPLVGTHQPLPSDLVTKLLYRFWSDEGYSIYPDVQPLLRKLRDLYARPSESVVVGLVTNSDDRVPDVLTSLGLSVSPARYAKTIQSESGSAGNYDVDFAVMSYDVGFEKPDRRIFLAAEEMLARTVQQKSGDSKPLDASSWQKVYVGDEYDKDVVGARGAGWQAVLIDRGDTAAAAAAKRSDMKWLDDQPAGQWSELFASSQTVGFRSLKKLAEWLPSKTATS